MEQWTRKRWERETRYYEARIHQDLWGNWVITRIWGKIGTKQGRSIHSPCASYEDAVKELEAIKKRRESRHYQPVTKPL